MTKVYRVHEGKACPMEEARCRDEARELQDLLERSPELLAGEQIDPENPRQWLLIKREMDVPDPVTGSARWSIDFLFVDQDAVLTFVECKRHDDTRSRREVIAQVLDYAANAPRLWRSDDLRRAAENTQQKHGRTLEEAVKQLNGNKESGTMDLFDRAIANLSEYKLRIVLFLEAAPPELKTLVEFLVKEFSRIQIVLVEAKRYRSNDVEVVAPTIWGYTEQVRRQRQLLAEALSGGRRPWDQDSFFAELSLRLPDGDGQGAVQKLFRELPSMGYRLTWGTGANSSLNVRLPGITERAIATITGDGDLVVNYGSLGNTVAETTLRGELVAALERQLGKVRPSSFPNCYPRIKNAEWASQADVLAGIFRNLSRQSEVGAVG